MSRGFDRSRAIGIWVPHGTQKAVTSLDDVADTAGVYFSLPQAAV